MNIPIIPPFTNATDTAVTSVQTRFSKNFEPLLPALAEFVEAEADLDFINHSYDPSVSFWARDRDVAEALLTECLANLRQLPIHHPEDRPLQRFALLLTALLDGEEPTYPRQLHREMKACFFSDYQISGYGRRASYRNAMLIQTRHLTDSMIKLSRFDCMPDYGLDPLDSEDPDAFPTLGF